MSECPCKHCPPEKRVIDIYCHSKCKEYKEWRAQKDMENAEIRRQKKVDNGITEYHRANFERNRRRNKK